jgi:hypothetical protein
MSALLYMRGTHISAERKKTTSATNLQLDKKYNSAK